MPLDYTNPNMLKFMTENFVKAEEKRMIWFLKNQEKLEKLATFPKNYKGLDTKEVQRGPIESCMSTLTSQNQSSVCNRRRKALRDGVVQGVSTLKILRRRKGQKLETVVATDTLISEPIMKSIDPDVKSILYKAPPSGGRRQYLEKRKRELPEDKYNFCETSTNEYGWRLRDSKLSRQQATHGRYFTFKRDINSRTGPQPDPTYYQQPPDEPYSKCSG